MRPWVIRVIVLTVLHSAGQVAVAWVRATDPDALPVTRPVVIAVLVLAAAGWGALDGRTARPDGTMTWFVAALVTGPVAGVLGLAGRAVFVDQTGTEALADALLGGAAFTALLVMLPALAALGVTRLLTSNGTGTSNGTLART